MYSQQKDPKDAVPTRKFIDKYWEKTVGWTSYWSNFSAVQPSSDEH